MSFAYHQVLRLNPQDHAHEYLVGHLRKRSRDRAYLRGEFSLLKNCFQEIQGALRALYVLFLNKWELRESVPDGYSDMKWPFHDAVYHDLH